MSDAAAGAPPLLRGRDLGRSYRGGARALDGVDLDLGTGEALALLGPNGAGKTTLLAILAGLASEHDGQVSWSRDGGGRVGWAPQKPALYGRLSVRENLELFAALEKRPDPRAVAGDLMERADLTRFADRPARVLSTGTLQRLNLAVALAGAPDALLLDEPTATLSPEQRLRLWEWIRTLRADGLAVLFSTQSVHEAARHADRILVLNAGRVAYAGTVDGLGDGGGVEAAEQAFLRLSEEPG